MIALPTAVRDAVVEAAEAGTPEEVCGVLGGSFDPDRNRVRSHYPAANVADRPRSRYEIGPEEQLAIFDRLAQRGEEIVGFYHSHPRGPPEPSATDSAEATWRDRSYVIVSLDDAEPTLGSWRWRGANRNGDGPSNGGRFEREALDFE